MEQQSALQYLAASMGQRMTNLEVTIAVLRAENEALKARLAEREASDKAKEV